MFLSSESGLHGFFRCRWRLRALLRVNSIPHRAHSMVIHTCKQLLKGLVPNGANAIYTIHIYRRWCSSTNIELPPTQIPALKLPEKVCRSRRRLLAKKLLRDLQTFSGGFRCRDLPAPIIHSARSWPSTTTSDRACDTGTIRHRPSSVLSKELWGRLLSDRVCALLL